MDHLWLDHIVQREPDSVICHEPGGLIYTQKGVDAWVGAAQSTIIASFGADHELITVQEFMFFGLLTEYCALVGLEFRRSQFIRQEAGKFLLSTSRLHLLAEEALQLRLREFRVGNNALMQLITSRAPDGMSGRDAFEVLDKSMSDVRKLSMLKELPPNDRARKIYAEIFELVGSCGQTLSLLLQARRYHQINDVALVALCVLLESLVGLSAFAFEYPGAPILRASISTYDKFDALWGSRCQVARVCPWRVEDLITQNPSISQTYIATSIVSLAADNHQACVIGSRCRGKVVEVDLPLHHQSCEGVCQSHDLTSEDLTRLETKIEDDGYGLLQWTSKALDDPNFCIRTSKTNTEYVAFSHVWFEHITFCCSR